MAHLIDKEVVMAEIERHRKIYMYDVDNKHSFGRMMECNDLLVFLDTLEAKEVDLEKEIEKCLKQHSMLAVGKKDFTDIAKHFFELGLKARKEKDK